MKSTVKNTTTELTFAVSATGRCFHKFKSIKGIEFITYSLPSDDPFVALDREVPINIIDWTGSLFVKGIKK